MTASQPGVAVSRQWSSLLVGLVPLVYLLFRYRQSRRKKQRPEGDMLNKIVNSPRSAMLTFKQMPKPQTQHFLRSIPRTMRTMSKPQNTDTHASGRSIIDMRRPRSCPQSQAHYLYWYSFMGLEALLRN